MNDIIDVLSDNKLTHEEKSGWMQSNHITIQDLVVYFFQGNLEGIDGWHYGVTLNKEIPTEKYVAFCEQLKKALDVLNEEG